MKVLLLPFCILIISNLFSQLPKINNIYINRDSCIPGEIIEIKKDGYRIKYTSIQDSSNDKNNITNSNIDLSFDTIMLKGESSLINHKSRSLSLKINNDSSIYSAIPSFEFDKNDVVYLGNIKKMKFSKGTIVIENRLKQIDKHFLYKNPEKYIIREVVEIDSMVIKRKNTTTIKAPSKFDIKPKLLSELEWIDSSYTFHVIKKFQFYEEIEIFQYLPIIRKNPGEDLVIHGTIRNKFGKPLRNIKLSLRPDNKDSRSLDECISVEGGKFYLLCELKPYSSEKYIINSVNHPMYKHKFIYDQAKDINIRWDYKKGGIKIIEVISGLAIPTFGIYSVIEANKIKKINEKLGQPLPIEERKRLLIEHKNHVNRKNIGSIGLVASGISFISVYCFF